MIRELLQKPYWAAEDNLPGTDFCREMCPPGSNENFPEGAVGIYVDDDFWSVAALPWSYKDTPLQDIVAELWPDYMPGAEFRADHDTIEAAIEHAADIASDLYRHERDLNSILSKLTNLLDEAKRQPKTLSHIPTMTQRLRHAEYFTRRWTHTVIAFAHEVDYYEEESRRSICKRCNLIGTHAVHEKRFIKKHNAGFDPDIDWMNWIPGVEEASE